MIQEVYYILGSISFCFVISSRYLCKCFTNNNNNNDNDKYDIHYIKLEEIEIH